MLDHVIHLLTYSEFHRDWTVEQVNRVIVPPVNLQQCAGIVEDGYLKAWMSWAFLPREKADIFLDGTYKIQVEDWGSGDVLVFMDFVAPFGHTRELYRLGRNLFPKYPKAEWRRHWKDRRVGVNL